MLLKNIFEKAEREESSDKVNTFVLSHANNDLRRKYNTPTNESLLLKQRADLVGNWSRKGEIFLYQNKFFALSDEFDEHHTNGDPSGCDSVGDGSNASCSGRYRGSGKTGKLEESGELCGHSCFVASRAVRKHT